MASGRDSAHARRTSERLRRGLADDLQRLRVDAGLSRLTLAKAAGVDDTYVGRIEDGRARPTIETYVRLAVALGADLSARVYPNLGPELRDRHQARILEWLLAQLHPRWQAHGEVAVRRPARGWIDLVLVDRAAGCVVAVEIQSALPRLEQIIRWSADKADALPSWDGWSTLENPRSVSRVLVVRATRTTRTIARQFAAQLEMAYPAHPDDVVDSLSGTRAWPGAGVVWVDLERGRFVSGRPG